MILIFPLLLMMLPVVQTCSTYLPQAFYKTSGLGQQGPKQTSIYLPPNAVRGNMDNPVQGPVTTNGDLAERAAALKAIQQLYDNGLLNDFLQPTWIRPGYHKQLGEQQHPPMARVLMHLAAAAWQAAGDTLAC